MSSTADAPPARRGQQQPRVRSLPAGRVESAGPDAAWLAERAGLILDPWQRLTLDDALAIDAVGRWCAFEVGLVVPRQNGKGSVLEALELSALFDADPALPPPLVLHSAHEFKTSAEHFRRMRDLVDGSDDLRKRVRIVRTAAGSESIELTSGARLRFVTRTGGSGRGFSADLIVVDEAFNLTAEAMGAMLPTMSARPNPQVWYVSSAGMEASSALERLRARGLKGGDPALAYLEWSVEEGVDPDDRDAWYAANPALGIRIPESFVERERAALPDEQFLRERLGVWASKDDRAGLDPAAWAAAADPSAERGTPVSWGVECARDRSWSAVAVAWRRPDGMTQASLTDYHPGTAWLEERVPVLLARWGGAMRVGRSAKGLLEGVGIEEVGLTETAVAHNRLGDALAAGTLRHGNEPALNVAARAVRWKPSGDTRILDRKGSTDVSPILAAALAVEGVGGAYDVLESVR